MTYQESEVKFYVSNLSLIEKRLSNLGATLEIPRVFEANLRYDTQEHVLSRSYQVLRLRLDEKARITYKGPAQEIQGVRVRKEIEFEVSDFNAAKALLEALGYQVTVGYEKYRTTYRIGGVHVLLDELPYGDFVEIEGDEPAEIFQRSLQLGLQWDDRAPESYLVLFERLKEQEKFPFRDLSFDNFTGINLTAGMLGLRPADLPDAEDKDEL